MKLLKAQITNFRSVEDSEPFDLDQVTCLVGKNEAGKSAILMALAALNPHPATPILLDRERDYPRRYLTQYAARHGGKEATAVSTSWQLSPQKVAAITKELGEGVLKSDVVQVTRAFGAQQPAWSISFDLPKAIANALDAARLDAEERAPLVGGLQHTTQLVEALTKLSPRTDKQEALLKRLQAYSSFNAKITSMVAPSLPQFMYFSSYDRMDGAVQIERLQGLVANNQLGADEHRGNRLFKEFLEFAGVPLDDILKVTTYETFNAKLQAASNNITDQILDYWTQNPDLAVEVRIEQHKPGDPAPFNAGTIARARIQNTLHRVDTPFSERSAGFVWFFSFLVKFAQVKNQGAPVVLLLDEPGLTLHGKAQADLLRFFDEKLAPHHQIVYSTHSPFMVSPDKFTSARIVEDRVDQRGPRRLPVGTKVYSDVLSRDPDTLFPLQGALGYEITQTLFIGKHTLLVEGPSDILYLKALSNAVTRQKKAGLDLRWTVCPAGGIGNIRPFVALFGGNKVNVAVLADYAHGQKKLVESLRTSQILAGERVLTVQSYTGKQESDIEDLFEPELYAELLNATFGLKAKHAATAAKLQAADASERLVKQAEAYFRTDVPATTPEFDHYRSSEWLISNPEFLGRDIPPVLATLDRAARLFADLNKFLA